MDPYDEGYDDGFWGWGWNPYYPRSSAWLLYEIGYIDGEDDFYAWAWW